MCLSAAYWARVDKIYFSAGREDAHDAGFSDAFLYKELSLPLEERAIPIERSLESEGLEPFKLWVTTTPKCRTNFVFINYLLLSLRFLKKKRYDNERETSR